MLTLPTQPSNDMKRMYLPRGLSLLGIVYAMTLLSWHYFQQGSKFDWNYFKLSDPVMLLLVLYLPVKIVGMFVALPCRTFFISVAIFTWLYIMADNWHDYGVRAVSQLIVLIPALITELFSLFDVLNQPGVNVSRKRKQNGRA